MSTHVRSSIYVWSLSGSQYYDIRIDRRNGKQGGAGYSCHQERRWWVIRDFPTFLKSGPGACWLWKKSIWTIKLGKLELNRHFKWIKNHIRNKKCKAVKYLLV